MRVGKRVHRRHTPLPTPRGGSETATYVRRFKEMATKKMASGKIYSKIPKSKNTIKKKTAPERQTSVTIANQPIDDNDGKAARYSNTIYFFLSPLRFSSFDTGLGRREGIDDDEDKRATNPPIAVGK